MSFEAAILMDFRYFIANTAVARVLPSRNGCICQIPEMNLAKCETISFLPLLAYENSRSRSKSYSDERYET